VEQVYSRMDQVHGLDSRVYGIGTHLGSSNPRSTIRILCSERVSTHLISVVRARSDDGVVGFSRWWRGRTHTMVAPSELAREGLGGGDSHPRLDAEGNNSSMACGGSFPPSSTVDGERRF
jgi:hypothetical protein